MNCLQRNVAVLGILLCAIAPAFADNIAFIGNSLTFHGRAPKIGWNGEWGMAASAVDKDFRSQLLARLERTSTRPFSAKIIPSVPLERALFESPLDLARALPALDAGQDVVVLQMGDNIALSGVNPVDFADRYRSVLLHVRGAMNPGGLLICLGKWWAYAPIDEKIEKECRAAGGRYVDLGSISRQPWGFAGTERSLQDAGVGRHPGDRAMAEIADRIYRRMVEGLPGLADKKP